MCLFLLGPLCDKVGSRVIFTCVFLCFASIPTACTGFVNNATGLAILRLFIGAAGGCFVMGQYWTSRMFTKEVAGTANALVGGWGNLGGGVTPLVMGSADAEKAWRTVSVVPAVVAFGIGILIYFVSDDAPKGQYKELKKHGQMPEVSAAASFRYGAFGVELTMNNAAALYFKEEFDLTTEETAAIASIFGWMNVFARGAGGGYISDKFNTWMGMRGRILSHTVLLACEGALVLVFANTTTLGSAIATMVFFSAFVQAAEGSTYGIVPYVDPPSTGSTSCIMERDWDWDSATFLLSSTWEVLFWHRALCHL
jgi:NNP family nitrate/nitrite transporter-like MFS transporter